MLFDRDKLKNNRIQMGKEIAIQSTQIAVPASAFPTPHLRGSLGNEWPGWSRMRDWAGGWLAARGTAAPGGLLTRM